jgi:hypothetical protein
MKYEGYVAFLSLFLLLNVCSSAFSQTIKGKVLQKEDSEKWSGLPGANVYWLDGNSSVQTDLKGNFSIEKSVALRLIIQFIGFSSDTIEVGDSKYIEVRLKRDNELGTVEIEARQAGTTISRLDPIKTEVLSTTELCKAACCNLSESFETNNTVDAVVTDAITGTRQIQMLGLSGIYTQTLRENLPQMRGLLSNAGFGQVPGTWIESIQISKGVGSVVNGFESSLKIASWDSAISASVILLAILGNISLTTSKQRMGDGINLFFISVASMSNIPKFLFVIIFFDISSSLWYFSSDVAKNSTS